MKRIIILYFIVSIFPSCVLTKSKLIDSGYYTPKNIEWINPQSGIEEIDSRLLSSFPIYYINNDTVFYRISSTNEIISDSIVYGVENSFKLEHCLVKKSEKKQIVFEKTLIYSVVASTAQTMSNLDTLHLLSRNSFSLSGITFEQQSLLTKKSKERILTIIKEFGR